jgi:hypothetical protein
MGDDIDVAGRSRGFQLAVVLVAILVLLAAAVAIGSLTDDSGTEGAAGGGSSGQDVDVNPDLGDGSGSGPEFGGDFGDLDLEDINLSEIEDMADWEELLKQLDPEDLNLNGSNSSLGEMPDLEEIDVPPPPYDISVEPEPTPGRTVIVTVEKDGEPVPGVAIAFNGETVGVTTVLGKTAAKVPYANELEVSARPATEQDLETVAATGGATGGATGSRLGAPRHLSAGDTATTESQRPRDEHENTTVRFDVRTDVTATSAGVALPGQELVVNLTIDGEPLRGVGAGLDGEFIGVTDSQGRLLVAVPDDAQPGDELTILLERDEFSGRATIEVGEIAVDVDPGILRMPGTSGTVSVVATDGDNEQPIAHAPVRITDDGGQIALLRTNEDGEATFALPWSNSVTASTTVGDMSATDSAGGMLTFGLVAISVVVAALAALLAWLLRNPAVLKAIKARAVGALLFAGELAREMGHSLYDIGRSVRATLANALSRVEEGLSLGLIFAPFHWLATRIRYIIEFIITLVGSVFEGDNESEPAPATESAEDSTDRSTDRSPAQPSSAYGRLLQYWHWLVRRVLGGRQSTKTAVEVEDRATEAGLPRRPVRRLRRAFQDVEYGFAPASERVDDAEAAVEDLKETTSEEQE